MKINAAKASNESEQEIAKIQQEDQLLRQYEKACQANVYEEKQQIKKDIESLRAKRPVDKERIARLAKPKDQWRMAKELVKLRR